MLRRAGNPAYPEPCCLIELPDGTRAKLPVSWAEVVNPSDPPPVFSDHELTPELWAGITEFLTLAALLHALGSSALCSSVAEEVADENRNEPANGRNPDLFGEVLALLEAMQKDALTENQTSILQHLKIIKPMALEISDVKVLADANLTKIEGILIANKIDN